MNGEDEGGGHEGAEEIAGDHDAAAVEAVEEDAGDGASENGGNSAGEKDAGDDHAGAALLHDEGEDGDIIEIIANFADDLAHPGVAVVAILSQQAREGGHGDLNDNNATLQNMEIDAMRAADWPEVRAIYLEGIATGNATFQKTVPEWEEWDAGHLAGCRLVARGEGQVAGWAALSGVSARVVYAGVAEVSVYVAARARGQGVGRMLLGALVAESERLGVWTLQAGIFPENQASRALHEWAGFRVVGVRERLGCMDGRWRDVVLMERRSGIV